MTLRQSHTTEGEPLFAMQDISAEGGNAKAKPPGTKAQPEPWQRVANAFAKLDFPQMRKAIKAIDKLWNEQ